MSLATSLLYPTAFLHNQYVTLLESERGAAIGEALQAAPEDAAEEAGGVSPKTLWQSLQLAVRVTSLAHAVIQFVVATLETLPLLAVTTVTVLSNCSHERLNRIRQAAIMALLAAWSPVKTSLETFIHPDVLSTRDHSLNSQNLLLERLFAYTLPSLSKIADQLSPEYRETLVGRIGELYPAPEEDHDEAIALDPLQRADANDNSVFGWRGELDMMLQAFSNENPSLRCQGFNLSSEQFVASLVEAVRRSIPHA